MWRKMTVSVAALLAALPGFGATAQPGTVPPPPATSADGWVSAGRGDRGSLPPPADPAAPADAGGPDLAGSFDELHGGQVRSDTEARRAFLTEKPGPRPVRYASAQALSGVLTEGETGRPTPGLGGGNFTETNADDFAAGCLPLDGAMRLALDFDPRIVSAIADSQIASAEELAAFSRFLPQLSLSARTGLGDTPPLDRRADDEVAVILNQEIFSFGARLNGYRAARLVHDASEYGIQNARNDIAAGIASAYLDYARTRELLVLANEQADTFRDDAESAASRLSRRVITLTDASQIRARYARARSDVITAEVEEARARVRLSSLAGEEVPCIAPRSISMVLEDDASAILAVPAETAVELAQLSSPALIRQRLRVEAAEFSVKEARRANLPTISLNSFYRAAEIESNIPGLGVTNEIQQDTRVGFSLEQQLYAGGRLEAQRRNARGRLLRAEAERDLEILATTDEVRRGLVAAQAARDAGFALQDAREQARIQIDSTLREYERRTKTLTDLVLATEAYYIAASQEVRARYQFYSALITLYSAMGLLVDFEGR